MLLPVGISFYTFQALGYMLDVYRGEIRAERNLFRYALFVSVFPQLVAGPIERSKNLLHQVHEAHDFDAQRALSGLAVMLLGFFEKLVIADRASLYVSAVYGQWQQAPGWQIALATAAFAFQIYGDFSGYSHIAIGAARVLGYDLSDEDLARVYESFGALAAKKPVSARELDAIIANAALQVPPTYRLVSYVVNSGNIIAATAHIVLTRNGESVQGLSSGDGPIDAALMAIEKIVGHHYELDDFQLQSVTSGREAMGEALVKLRDGGKLYSGRGISTDIVGASIRAYLNALNKIVYREK